MSDPISGTGLAGGALTGASVYGLLTGTDYGVVFGAFAGAVFYIATAADLSASRRLAYFIVSYIAGILCSGLVGSKLANLTGYSDKPLDAIGAVIHRRGGNSYADGDRGSNRNRHGECLCGTYPRAGTGDQRR